MVSDFLAKFITANEPTSRFLYGLVFFISGVGIFVQYPHENPYSFSKNLWLLGLFAFMHGINEWLDMFIPLQASYLASEMISYLEIFLLAFATLAFVALFIFGLRLIIPKPKLLYDLIPFFFYIPWISISAFLLSRNIPNAILIMSDLSRYMLYFPASIITAVGFYQQMKKSQPTPYFQKIRRTLLNLVYIYIFYALFSGLIVGPEPYFPASVINSDRLYSLTHVSIKILRAFCGTIMMIYTLKLLFLLNKEAAHIFNLAKQDALRLAERERIAQDLHDGVIQTLYATGLMLESCLRQLQPKSALEEPLKASMTSLNHSMTDLRNYISGLENEAITHSLLKTAIKDIVEEFQRNYKISVQYIYEANDGLKLSSNRQKHLYFVLKELFNNVVKHANATQVNIRIQSDDQNLVIIFSDNGTGFSPEPISFQQQCGMGLRHIHERITVLQGNIAFSCPEHGGTQVIIQIPKEVKNYGDSLALGR